MLQSRSSTARARAASAAWVCLAVACASGWGAQPGPETPAVAAPVPGRDINKDIPQSAIDAVMCGSLANASGPFDYRDPANRGNIALINANHFNEDVQNLVRGETNYLVLADLDFILRSFPNHYPALQTASRYFLAGGKRHRWRTMECYFDRAMRFVPEDSTVRVLYGIYLLKSGKKEDALNRLMEALDLSPDSAEIQYDIGLIYVELGDYSQANRYAARAYQGGYPLPGLRHKLERLGQWNPPQPAPAASNAAPDAQSPMNP